MSATTSLAKWIAVGGGAGLAPVAPGTFGTLAAIPLYLLLAPLPLWAYLLVVVVITLLGVWASSVHTRTLGTHDHGSIVIDEVAGYLITMIAAPVNWQSVVLGFVLFRLFDIWKPWPIRRLDHGVPGGWGIMLDDVVAGLFAMVVLQLLPV